MMVSVYIISAWMYIYCSEIPLEFYVKEFLAECWPQYYSLSTENKPENVTLHYSKDKQDI